MGTDTAHQNTRFVRSGKPRRNRALISRLTGVHARARTHAGKLYTLHARMEDVATASLALAHYLFPSRSRSLLLSF